MRSMHSHLQDACCLELDDAAATASLQHHQLEQCDDLHLDERLGRFMQSLRQLDASAFAPPSPTQSFCGSDLAGGCGASTVSISPSDSASCCCRGGASNGGHAVAWEQSEAWATAEAGRGTNGDADLAPADVQAAIERTLARQLRQLQLQHKAALAEARQHGAGGTPGKRHQPGRLPSPPPRSLGGSPPCDALLQCSPSSAASCSGPRAGSGVLRPTALQFAPAGASGSATVTDAPGNQGDTLKAPAAAGRRGVFVGNLPSAVTERALMALFSRCGPIDSLWIARDPRNQLSLGYGYVVYSSSDPSAHVRAARSLDGASLERQAVRVRLSDRDFDAPVHHRQQHVHHRAPAAAVAKAGAAAMGHERARLR